MQPATKCPSKHTQLLPSSSSRVKDVLTPGVQVYSGNVHLGSSHSQAVGIQRTPLSCVPSPILNPPGSLIHSSVLTTNKATKHDVEVESQSLSSGD